jgi:hypothetical protein
MRSGNFRFVLTPDVAHEAPIHGSSNTYRTNRMTGSPSSPTIQT